MRKKSLFFMVAVLTACLVGSTWAQTTIEAVNEHWLREIAADTVYDVDGVTVWSTSKGDRRYGIIEFDLSSLAGEPIMGATLELYSAVQPYSDYGTPIIQTAYVFDCTTGTAFTDLTWNIFMDEKDAGKVALETLGAYDLPAASTDETQQDAFVASEASGADLALIQAAVDAGGNLCIVMVADESGAYGQSWGDGEAAWSGEAPRLIITAPDGRAYNPDPALGQEGVPANVVLSWEVYPPLYVQTPSFEVYFTTNSDPNMPGVVPAGVSTTSYDPDGDLEYKTTYYWRVDVIDPNYGEPIVYEGDIWSFTTASETPPPSDPDPASGAGSVLAEAVLKWNSHEDAFTHEVYLREGIDEWELVAEIEAPAATEYQFTGRWDTTYEWYVIDVFPGGVVVEGDTWTFNTATPECNGGERLPGDENDDCYVTLADVAITASNWLTCGWEPAASCGTWPYPPTSNIIITTHMEIWIRNVSPDTTFEGDFASAYNPENGDIRTTLVEFDLSALEGKTLTGARMYAWNLNNESGNAFDCKSHAFIIDPNQTPASSSTWNTYQAEYAGTEVPLALGAFDVPMNSSGAYFASTLASPADMALIEAETIANGGDGILTLVLMADDDPVAYRFDIGDDTSRGSGNRLYIEFATE